MMFEKQFQNTLTVSVKVVTRKNYFYGKRLYNYFIIKI